MPEQQLMDVLAAYTNFPEPPKREVSRVSSLDAIEDVFKNDVQVVVVEGEEGIGKTTLLSQFARRHPEHTFSLFIMSTSRLGYDPDTLREDLCIQLEWALHKRDLEISEGVDDSLLRIQLNGLKRRRRAQRETFYFVIDGLEGVPSEGFKQAIFDMLDMLPWGLPGFHFLLSGNYDEFSVKISEKIRVRPHQLARFRPEQTKSYLSDLITDEDSQLLEEIHHTCRGIPGRLVDVRRNLEAGTPAQVVLDNLPNLFEIEWKSVDVTNSTQLRLLGLMAFSHRNHSLDDFVRILHIESSVVEQLLGELSFIKFRDTDISFVSDTFRKFVVDKLKQFKDLRSEVTNLLIDDLFQNPDDQEAHRDIPLYLQQEGRYDDLLDYLSPEHCTKVLESSQSVSLVQQHLDLGINTALKLKRSGEFVRFSIQKSIISELHGIDTWRSEIEARLALDDYETALALAYGATLKQEQLHLLVIIAKARQEKGIKPEHELMEQIRLLYDQLDFSTLGKDAVDIASDLIYLDQDLAIRMVEQATKSDTDGHSSDWAFVGLSFAAFDKAAKGQNQSTDALEAIRSHIKDPEARRFSATVSLMLGDYSASRIMTEAKKIEDISDQLFLLRLWTMENREREDAAEVVDYAYSLAISHTAEEYVPTRDLRALATPLPFIKDKAKARDLVSKFSSQLGITERYGPTEDHVRLQLLLAWTESNYDFETARQRIEEIYYFISDVKDLVVRTDCLARLTSTLVCLDPDKRLEVRDKVHTLVENELSCNVTNLLDSTAEHLYAIHEVIGALAKTKPDMALELAMRLNTEARREKALQNLVEVAIRLPIDKLDLEPIQKAVEAIVDKKRKGIVIFNIITRLATLSEKATTLPTPLIPQTLQFINAIGEIQDAQPRCNAYCLAYVLLMRQDPTKYSELASDLLNQLDKTWQEIDVKWIKVDVGFDIAETLAEDAPEKAREYLRLAGQVKDECTLDTKTAASAYLQSLQLAIRAYIGLLPKQVDTPDDLERLTELIARVPSCGEQAGLWADLALRLSVNGRLNECEQIVAKQVKPLLAKISKDDTGYRTEVIITLSPVLYRAHSPTALAQILELPLPARDKAYTEISEFLLQQQPPKEPYDYLEGQGYKNLTFENMVSICELLNLMCHDAQIYDLITGIADSIIAFSRGRDRLPNEQLSAIITRLEEVISKKLPDCTKRHIVHDGYKIVAQAQIARIREVTRDKPKLQEWLDLIETARKIPNLADKSLVLFTIGTVMPSKEAQQRRQVLEEAMGLVEQIPTMIDKMGRYVTFAQMVYEIDPLIFRECLKLAMKLAIKDGDSDPGSFMMQREIIDLANRIDPGFAASLAKLADDDPARAKAKKNIEDHLQLLKLRKEMAELCPPTDFSPPPSTDKFPDAAWMNLGILNAGRINAVHFDNIVPFIQASAGMPLSKSYPIFAWVIENAVQRFAKTNQAVTYLRPMFEAMLIGTSLSERMAARSAKRLEQAISYTAKSPDTDSLLVLSGERERAIKFIRNWFANKVQDYLKIHDPYFGPDDLEVLQLLSLEKPTCKVQILTSQEHQERQKVSKPWEETYRTYWRIHITEQDPPDTDIVIIGTKSGKSPIHDRWWLTQGAGIRIGTSLNGLGGVRVSEISELTPEEVEARQKLVDQYLFGYTRELEGEKLFRWQFPLLSPS